LLLASRVRFTVGNKIGYESNRFSVLKFAPGFAKGQGIKNGRQNQLEVNGGNAGYLIGGMHAIPSRMGKTGRKYPTFK
jgi:hypothetical protein